MNMRFSPSQLPQTMIVMLNLDATVHKDSIQLDYACKYENRFICPPIAKCPPVSKLLQGRLIRICYKDYVGGWVDHVELVDMSRRPRYRLRWHDGDFRFYVPTQEDQELVKLALQSCGVIVKDPWP